MSHGLFFSDIRAPTTSSSSKKSNNKKNKVHTNNLLVDLPSTGHLLDVEDSTTSGTFAKYVCLHETSPELEIKTDTTTMLIRAFSLKKRSRKKKSSSSSSKKRKSSSLSSSNICFEQQTSGKRRKSTSANKSSNESKKRRNRRLELASLRERLQRQGLDTVGTESELRLRLRQHEEESAELQVRLEAHRRELRGDQNTSPQRGFWDIEF